MCGWGSEKGSTAVTVEIYTKLTVAEVEKRSSNDKGGIFLYCEIKHV